MLPELKLSHQIATDKTISIAHNHYSELEGNRIMDNT